MKTKNIETALIVSAMLCFVCGTVDTFAAGVPYDMEYAGGTLLENNVTINPTLVDGLTPLVQPKNIKNMKFSQGWLDGYVKITNADASCRKVKYYVFNNEATNSKPYYDVLSQKYASRILLDEVTLDGVELENKNLSVSVFMNDDDGFNYGVPKGGIGVGFPVYLDSGCSEIIDGIYDMEPVDTGGLFVKTNQKIYEDASMNKILESDKLYYGIIDIDASQSFKILNSGNELTKDNMFARSKEELQDSDSVYKNMFVSSGNYIYSQHEGADQLSLIDDNGVFVKITSMDVLKDGINVVYGFQRRAGSALGFYAQQWSVEYLPGKDGSITGIQQEDVISGNNPTGTTIEPNDGYVLDYWVADKDVTLVDGTIIKTGEKITSEQIKSIVVTANVKLTAIYSENKVIVPNTGTITKDEENNAFVFGLLIPVGVIIAVATVHLISRCRHAVKFD